MPKYAIPLGKGELPYEARSTDEEMEHAFNTVAAAHPNAQVLVERRRGGAIKITIGTKEHPLTVSGPDGFDTEEYIQTNDHDIPF
jgi:hypothetical protein